MERGRLVTVFGGSGFLGRHLIQRFAQAGARIRVVSRSPDHAIHLQPLGDAGQIALMYGGLGDPDVVTRAVAGADVVINLAGILYESRFYESLYGPGGQTFQAVHVDGARRLAEAATDAGVSRFIHVSAIGAATDSPARYGRSKAAGEAAVRRALPELRDRSDNAVSILAQRGRAVAADIVQAATPPPPGGRRAGGRGSPATAAQGTVSRGTGPSTPLPTAAAACRWLLRHRCGTL